MKINWMSNAPWCATGYGNQTKLFVPRIQSMLGHEMAITAFHGLSGGLIHFGKELIPVYPRFIQDWGGDIMDAHTRHFGAEVLITLMDSWVVNVEQLRSGVKWVPWFPIDHEPIPAAVARKVKQAYKRIVFTKFAERMCLEAGLDCYYVPHGVDCDIFRPIDRVEARKQLGWPDDKFIIGMVAANKGSPSRKALPANIEAFARLHTKYPDTLLYLHTTRSENNEYGGINLPEFCDFLGVSEAILFANQYNLMLGFNDEYMNAMYNALDVHLLVSMGEGFGIPIVEAQAAGCPVIVGDWTSMSELCFSGWKVKRKESQPFWTPIAAYQFQPAIEAIEDRLEQSYRMWGNQDYRERARKGALAYDADKVTEKYWKPVLAEIERMVEEWQ